VYVAVHTLESVDDCTRLVKLAPAATTIDEDENPTGVSENVNVTVEDAPTVNAATVDVIATVGATVSSV